MPWAMLVLGGVAGIALGWLLLRSRVGGGDGAPQAAAAQARIDELRSQLAQARDEAEALRRDVADVQNARVAAETRAVEVEKNLVEQKALLDDARGKLTETFKALASDVLSKSNTDFLKLAEQRFSALRDGATGELDARKVAIEQMVRPIQETLGLYQRETQELEKRRLQETGALSAQLHAMAESQGNLQQETAKLVNALRSPQVRGRWGEIALRRTAELAGMSDQCDFMEQVSVNTESGRLRPDMIVRLPAGREVVVDSKVPLDGFLKSLEARTDQDRNAALYLHAAQLRQHVNALASKQYWDQFQSAPEFVVLFIPNDSFLAAAAEREPSVIEDAMMKKVVIATPTTFIALLRAIAYGWRQEQVAESAQQVSELGKKLYERIVTFLEHLDGVGAHLRKAVEAYNRSVASVHSRLIPLAEKFEDLGVATHKAMPELEQLTEMPRVAAQRALPGTEPPEEPRTLAAENL
jgi:DNA recombination protein RmuC